MERDDSRKTGDVEGELGDAELKAVAGGTERLSSPPPTSPKDGSSTSGLPAPGGSTTGGTTSGGWDLKDGIAG